MKRLWPAVALVATASVAQSPGDVRILHQTLAFAVDSWVAGNRFVVSEEWDGTAADLTVYLTGEDSTYLGVGTSAPTAMIHADAGLSGSQYLMDLEGTVSSSIHAVNIDPTITATSGSVQAVRLVPSFNPGGSLSNVYSLNTNFTVSGTSSNSISNLQGVFTQAQTIDSYSGAISSLYGVRVNGWVTNLGGATVTNQYGVYVNNPAISGTNNYAYYSAMNSGAGKWGYYGGGTADSYFGGNVGIKDTTPSYTLDVNGVVQAQNGVRTNAETVTDFTGTGLQLSGGALQSTLGTTVSLTSEVTGILPVANGGTGASTLAGLIGLTTDVNGVLPVANGGTGSTTLNNLITLSTHTTGNYVATVADAGNSTVTVTGSGSEGAAVTLDVVDVNCVNCLGTLEIADSYILNSGDNPSGTYNFDGGTLYINSVGNTVGIGTSSPSSELDVVGDAEVSGILTVGGTFNAGSGGLIYDSFLTEVRVGDDLKVGDLLNVTNLGAVGTDPLCWDGSGASNIGDCSSSARYKEGIVAIEAQEAAGILRELRPVKFRWKEMGDLNGAAGLGLIAEEVAAVEDSLVRRDPDGSPGSVRYHAIVPVLVRVVQEQWALIDNLAARVAALEAAAR